MGRDIASSVNTYVALVVRYVRNQTISSILFPLTVNCTVQNLRPFGSFFPASRLTDVIDIGAGTKSVQRV